MVQASDLHARIAAALEQRRQTGTLRTLDVPPYDPTSLVDLSSNDYLSLSRSVTLQDALKADISAHQGPLYGPASSRLLDGNTDLHLDLERRLAHFFKGQAALLFNSGFDANVGIFASLPSADDVIVYDELIHASCHDGMRHSRARTQQPFKHNDPVSLEILLKDLARTRSDKLQGGAQIYVAVESLYSMDGDIAPLSSYLDIIEKLYPRGNCHLILDEAHTTGLCGPQGRGLACALGVQDRILIRLHTFGKAMSCAGGAIICSPTLRNYFINYARPLIYSTVMSHMSVLTVKRSLLHLEQGRADTARRHLAQLASYTQQLLQQKLAGIPFVHYHHNQSSKSSRNSSSVQDNGSIVPFSPIIAVLTKHPRPLSKYLISRGYLVRPIAHPTVPKGQERIRICLHSCNTRAEIEGMVDAIVEWTKSEEAHRLFNVGTAVAKL